YQVTRCNFQTCQNYTTTEPVTVAYYSGDFNGDGLTDVIAVEEHTNDIECDWNGFYCDYNQYQTRYKKTHFINLDRRITTNFANESGLLEDFCSAGKIFVADVTGNGKSNLVHFVRDQ